MNDQNQNDAQDAQEEQEKKSKRHRMEFDLTMMQTNVSDKKRKVSQFKMDIQRLNRQKFQIDEEIKVKEKEINNIQQDLVNEEDELNRFRKKIDQLH